MLRDDSERPEVPGPTRWMTGSGGSGGLPKGHVIRLMKSSVTGRNVTSLQSKFRF